MASYIETASDIVREAGALVIKFLDRRIGFELKGDYDLVTEADRTSEKLIVERLHGHFPTHAIVGEESGSHIGSSEYCWYVDPLDGTTNFAHGFPAFNVTMGLEQAGEMVAGVIFDPLRNELFTAERGSGAYLNGRRIQGSKAARIADALVATGFPSRKRHLSHGVRRAGSAALDLAYTACGRLDAFWEFNLNPWDVAAGVLLVREAGGTVSDMRGGPMELRGKHILADNTVLHEPLVGLFADIFAGKYQFPLPEMHD